MKKLLTTMSAVAMAMSLFAADDGALSGTNFEVPDVGTYNIEESTGELTPPDESTTYWETNSTATLTIESGRPIVSTRPEAFADDGTQDKYLSIKTTLGNPVSRYVNTGKTAVSIGNGLYFDSLVKFTVFDSDPTIASENPKLAIWLKESEDSSSTNLMITAGYLSGASTVVVTNYSCNVLNDVDIYDGGWHRVTVKMISNILASDDAPGFVVFVDGEKVVCPDSSKFATGISLETGASFFDAEGSLFPSAMLGSTAGMITAVDFDGQGSVDDIVFTTKAPDFAEDKDFFTIALGENVTSVPYTLYNGDGTPVASDTLTKTTSIVLPAAGYYFTLGEIEYATGYMDGGKTGITPDVNDNYSPTANSTLTISAAQAGAYIGSTPYKTLADAITNGVNTITDAGDYKVTMAANADAGVTINNANTGVNIILDLAGNTITNASDNTAAIYVQAGNVTVTNSTVEVGKVQGSVSNGVLGNAATKFRNAILTIQDGIYEGTVLATAISGGSFLATYNNQEVNTKAALDAILDGTGYEATLANNYYTLTEKATTYKVVYVYGQDGEFAVTNDNLASGDTTPAAPAEAAITGYTLTWTPEVAATVTADATYTATYTPINYTITFVDGETSTPVTKAYGTTIETTDVPSFAGKTGYTAAWNEEPVGATVTGDKTYTAVYTAIEYSITYMHDETALTGLNPATYTVENAVTLPTEVNLGVMGVEFESWTNAEGRVVAGWAVDAKTGNQTFYAKTRVTGSGSFDGGDEDATFSIDAGTQATIAAALPTGKTLSDKVFADGTMTYAQAYALGLLNTSTGDVGDLDATIEIKDGKVVVGLNATPLTAYTITLKVYEKSSLNVEWPKSPTQTYTLDETTATTGFTPAAGASNFYKTEVVITDKQQ